MSAQRLNRRGFTLMEIVIAVTITAFIGLGIGVAFNNTIKAKETVETTSEHYRMLRTAMARMTREIGAAYVSDRYDSKRYRDAFDRPTNFVGARDKRRAFLGREPGARQPLFDPGQFGFKARAS